LRNEIGVNINKLAESGEHVWGVNLILHLVTGVDAFMEFVPDILFASEIDFLPGIDLTTTGMKCEKVLASHFDPDFPKEYEGVFPDWKWVWSPDFKRMEKGYFNGFGDTLLWTAYGHSVVFTGPVQVAAWMGFDEVCLIGCETTVHGHAYPEIYEPPSRDKERQGLVQASAAVARKEYESRGKRLIDCSGPTGTLPLEKGDFLKVLGDRSKEKKYLAWCDRG